MIEATIDDAGEWPYGRIHLVMIGLYDTYRQKSRLDRTQMDRDKLAIKMAVGEHPDVLFEQAMMVRKKYRSRRTKLTWDELISCVVTGATSTYQSAFTVKMLDIDNEPKGQIVLTALKHLGSELYTGISLSRIRESDHETSLIQFNNDKNNNENENNSQVQWQQGMQCYWCWKLGHKVTNCPRKAAGDSKLPNPGGGDNNNNNNTSGVGGNDDNNNNDDGNNNNCCGGKCGRCNGLHATKNCYHDPANALKRPDGLIVKDEFSEKELGLSSFSNYKPDFSIIAIDIAVDLSNNNNNNYNNVVSPDWKQHASTKQTIPFSVPNGENSSVESREQHGSFKTENDIDFEDDYIDLDNNSNNVDPDADANGNDTSSDGYITVVDNDYVHISNETDFEIEFEDDTNNNINNTSTDDHNSVGDNNNNDNNNDIEIEFDDDNNNDIEMNKIDPEAHADGDSTSSEDITVGEETSNDNHIIVGDNNRDNNNNNSNNANNSDNTSDDIIVGEMNKRGCGRQRYKQ